MISLNDYNRNRLESIIYFRIIIIIGAFLCVITIIIASFLTLFSSSMP